MLINGKPGNSLSIRDRGLLYGDGVFRTLRARRGEALHWSLHYRKLHHDCSVLGIACPEFAVLTAELSALLSQQPDAVMKIIVTRGGGSRGYAPTATEQPTHLWDVSPLPEYPTEWAAQGIKARLCELRLSQQPRFAGAKHLNRLENVMAAAEWSDAEIAEGLLLDVSGNVIEGTRSNLFMVKDGTLLTPDLTYSGVAGVQRDRVIDWAHSQDMPCRVERFGWKELLEADEIFLVNSIIGLWPVRELQDRLWTQHPIAFKLQS